MSKESGHHHAFSPRLSFLLDNPLRRRLDPASRLVDHLKISTTDTVMDFGCGPGYHTIEIAKRAKRTIGVDISEEMLEKAHRAAAKARVTIEFLQSNGESIQLPPSSIDLILLVHVYHEIPDKPTVLKEFRRILKRRGRIVIQERLRGTLLSRFIPGPPIVDVNIIMEAAGNAKFSVTSVEPFAGRSSSSLVTLKMIDS